MGVLRGWRLLQAACLNAEETRDILSTTQNKLEFEAISKALQTLWDEQLLGQRYPFSAAAPQHGHLYWQSWEDDQWSYDGWDASHDDGWWEAQWHDEYQGDEWSWDDDAHGPHEPPSLAPGEEEDEQLKEAQQAEQAAEQLALEAKRTWAEAQRTTQQMRKDRGFGQINAVAVKCFNCGGSHFARDCPDKRVFPYKGGKGKNNHMMDYDENQLYYMNGSKGKEKKGSKGKYKSSNMMDYQAMWASKSKGKGKMVGGKSVRTPVNAYTAYYDLGGLEMQQASTGSVAAVVKESSTSSACGMLDCGATASAAPDLAVQGLIQTILKHDSGARVDIQPYMRPFFRFGNGKWGQALYRTTISSNVSGQHREFSLYSLPNPEDPSPKNLVPILIGMDHIGSGGMQMMVDFSLGYVIDGVDTEPEIYQLNTNNKGHFIYDVVFHLTRGHTNQQGSAVVNVDRKHQQAMVSTLQFRPLEFYHSQVDRSAHVSDEQRKQLLWRLHQHVKSNDAAHQAHSMCSSALKSFPDDISFRDILRHGSQNDGSRAGDPELHQGGQEQSSTHATRCVKGDRNGSSRSPSQGVMALSQQPCTKQLAEEPSRHVASL